MPFTPSGHSSTHATSTSQRRTGWASRKRRSGKRRNAALGALSGLALILASLAPTTAFAAGPQVTMPVATSMSASVAASETGEPVEIVSETTPTERLLALPDGTMQYEVSTVPVRVADDNGNWVDIDLNLEKAGEWWEPAASATPVRFGAGGSDILDEVQTAGGEWITERWPHGLLPAPLIDGATATYPQVFPGVDLKLTATDIGMASVYVVKSPAAASNLALEDLHVEMEGADISRDANGNFEAETEAGETVVSSMPLWWDSSDGGTFLEPGDDPAQPVEHSHTDSSINLDVAETIDGEQVTYPIFIDPEWSSGENASWYTDIAYPNASYLNAATQRVGKFDIYDSRMYMEFPISALAGKDIVTAQLNTTQLQLAASPNNPLEVRLRGYQAPGFTWNQQNNSLWGALLDTKNPGTWGGPAVAVGWNVTAGVKTRVAGGSSAVQFGFIPQNPSAQSRRHFDNDATLIVTYNSAPSNPTLPKITSPVRDCGSASSPAYVSGTSIVVSVSQSDPDAGTVDTNFTLASAPALTALQTKSSGSLADGPRSVTFTGLADGDYAWRARGWDGRLNSAGYSAWCYFRVDNQAPALPFVTTTASSFTVGQPVSVSLASVADAAGYQYWLAYSGSTSPAQAAPVAVSRTAALPDCQKRVGGTRFACATGATPVSITMAPVDALSVLWVAAYDKAGNVSTATPLPLFTSEGTPAARDPRVDTGHAWMTTSMMDPLPSEIEDANYNTPLPLSLPTDSATWQSVNELRPGYTVPVLQPHEPADPSEAMMTPGPAVDAKASFSLSMWVNPWNTTSPAQQYIAVQSGSNRDVSLELKNGKYYFCVMSAAGSADTASLVSGCAVAPTNAVQDQWTFLTGVWDATNQQLRLYVDGSMAPDSVTPHKLSTATGTYPPGEFMIGPPPTSLRFGGLVANPVVVPGVMDSRQRGSLRDFSTPFTF
ncbi:LamG domain-containing protein [Microbacterium sulfonylureivorans]|uniref:LamG domain-containing protein n=1 Tax=Microbacterium sulfonylureivorans TaxID=2486854 RepID=UPI0013DF4B60|nr:LamG domain-containing protein [Microbacterium sulfonylureivorans]